MALLLLDAIAVCVIGEFVLRQDVDLHAGTLKVAAHDRLFDAVLDASALAQTVGNVGDLDGLAVGCDSLVSSLCFVLLFVLLKSPDDRDDYEIDFYIFSWNSFTREGYCIVASR